MTPAQLRAFACVVRQGSVKGAAAELGVTEPAVSMHLKQLRDELGDPLFARTPSGLAFTPGGLRLASRAAEILDLQQRTVLEVSEAGHGRRLLRLASSASFAEHAAPGLISLFTGRARDLDVELSVHRVSDFASLLTTRAVDVALGTAREQPGGSVVQQPFLAYEVVVVSAPEHPVVSGAAGTVGADQLADQVWNLGPGAADSQGEAAEVLGRMRIPESRQRIFQSDAAALAETRRGTGLTVAIGYTVRDELRRGRLVRLDGAQLAGRGAWATWTLAGDQPLATAAELVRFARTPRATQAMLRGESAGVGRFRPAVHVTLWS